MRWRRNFRRRPAQHFGCQPVRDQGAEPAGEGMVEQCRDQDAKDDRRAACAAARRAARQATGSCRRSPPARRCRPRSASNRGFPHPSASPGQAKRGCESRRRAARPGAPRLPSVLPTAGDRVIGRRSTRAMACRPSVLTRVRARWRRVATPRRRGCGHCNLGLRRRRYTRSPVKEPPWNTVASEPPACSFRRCRSAPG